LFGLDEEELDFLPEDEDDDEVDEAVVKPMALPLRSISPLLEAEAIASAVF
jgi:hypothetical protein